MSAGRDSQSGQGRLPYVILLLVTLAAGLTIHLHAAGLSGTARDILGDALWAAMILWLVTLVAPGAGLLQRASAALAICFAVEFSQELKHPVLQAVRGSTLGHLVLGSDFDARDLVAYTAGVGTAALLARTADRAALPRLWLTHRFRAWLADVRRHREARSRPDADENARRLRDRGESLDSIIVRDAVPSDIPALSELHVTMWNATYRTSNGPSVSTRIRQWEDKFGRTPRSDFVVVMEDRDGRLIGFAAGTPDDGEFDGQLSKIYLRWEYHGLGLGRRLMEETARRFLERGMESFILFAERSNPTIGFYDRMGGERLLDDRGLFHGAYAWRDARTLLE